MLDNSPRLSRQMAAAAAFAKMGVESRGALKRRTIRAEGARRRVLIRTHIAVPSKLPSAMLTVRFERPHMPGRMVFLAVAESPEARA